MIDTKLETMFRKIFIICNMFIAISASAQLPDLKTRMTEYACSCINEVIDTIENRSVQPEIDACLAYTLEFFKQDDDLVEIMKDSKDVEKLFTEMKIFFFTSCIKLVKFRNKEVVYLQNEFLNKLNSKYQRDFSEGQKLFMENKFVLAKEKFLTIYKIDSTLPQVLDYIGLCYRSMSNTDTALVYFTKSLDVNPDNLLAWLNHADMLLAGKNLKEAFYSYLKLIEINPSYPEGYLGIGKVLLNNQEYDKAIINLDYALRIYRILESPFIKDAEFLIGYSYFMKGDYNSAKPWFDKAKEKGFVIPEGIGKKFGY
jgi:tetratricopeptide (TPR) repeat protein